jgi:hypothetical protein
MFSESGGRGAGRKSVSVLALGLIVAVALVSCSEFSVRESLPPAGGATEYALPQEPDLVISNLINGVTDQMPGNYTSMLAEDFVFVPDPRDAQALENYYPGVFLNWERDVETRVIEYMLDESRTGFALLTFSNEGIIEQTDSTYILQEEYSLIIKMESLETYLGTARLYMKRHSDDGLWWIHKWEDSQLPEAGEDTWGVLRGEIRAST